MKRYEEMYEYDETREYDENDETREYEHDETREYTLNRRERKDRRKTETEMTEVSIFVRGTQVYALVIVTVLVIADKGLGLMVTSPSEIYYAVLGAYGLGGTQLVKAIENFRKF